MKKTLIPAILAATLLALPLFSACDLATPAGEDVTEVKDFTGFDRVDIDSAFEAEITRADKFSVVIIADESLIDLVEVTQDSDTLDITLTPHHIFTDFTLGNKTLRAEITMPALKSLALGGASKGKLTGFSSTEAFELQVSGASTLQGLELGAGDVEFDISGASKISGNLTANNLDFEISGASTIELSGSANDLRLNVDGASKAGLGGLPVADADVHVDGASQATVNVRGMLDVELSGASQLYFFGNPTMGETDVSGASTIKHK